MFFLFVHLKKMLRHYLLDFLLEINDQINYLFSLPGFLFLVFVGAHLLVVDCVRSDVIDV